MDESFYAGVAKVDITPAKPSSLSGFAYCSSWALRVMLIKQFNEEGALQRALIVTADIFWWDNEQMERLYERLHKEWAIPREATIIQAAYSVSAAMAVDDCEYQQYIENQLFAAIFKASNQMEAVQIEIGRGRGESEKNEKELTVVRWHTQQGATKALWISSNQQQWEEFTSEVAEQLEQEHGDGLVCMFLHGDCEIDQPAVQAPDQLKQCVLSIAGKSMEAIAQDVMKSQDLTVLTQKSVEVYLNIIVFAEKLALLAMRGQMSSEYGDYIRRLSDQSVLPLSSCNGISEHVPSDEQEILKAIDTLIEMTKKAPQP